MGSGCSILGSKLDDELGIDADEGFTRLGFEFDTLIIQSMLLPREAPIQGYYDYIACGGGEMKQVCTALKGCWCEKNQ